MTLIERTMLEVIAAALQSKGLSAGLIRGYLDNTREKWGKELRRCKRAEDAIDLADDIAREIEPLRDYKALRAHEFHCKLCDRSFEEFFQYNTHDADVLEEFRQRAEACPGCGNPASQKFCAPGFSISPWYVKFGGHVYKDEDFDARVDSASRPTKAPAFYEKKDFEERFIERFEETAIKTMAGELPSPPPIDSNTAQEIAAAITKGV